MKLTHIYNTIRTKLGIPTIVTIAGIQYYCPTFMEQWRAETLFTKEPETVAWINTFKASSVLWDIGANVGTYTMYAAKQGHFVVAVEPSDREYQLLKKNIELNHVWADPRKAFLNEQFDYRGFPQPDYIKIDTDGFDLKIVKGLIQVLPNVKELSIELDPRDRSEIISFMKGQGFMLQSEASSDMFKGTPYENIRNGIFVKKANV